jgi:hypothetical protein
MAQERAMVARFYCHRLELFGPRFDSVFHTWVGALFLLFLLV